MDKGEQGAEVRQGRPSFAEINLGAIGRNVRAFKDLISGRAGGQEASPEGRREATQEASPDSPREASQEASPEGRQDCRLMAVVKANGYGHGVLPVTEAALANGADWLGVALPQEALELREAGIDAPIMVLGYTEPQAYEALIRADVRLTAYTFGQGEAMAKAARAAGEKARVHLKVDTGMSRIGFWPDEDAIEQIRALAALEGLALEGCFTHFARADEDDEKSWRSQLRLFQDFLDRLKSDGLTIPIAHCANTAACMRAAEARMDMVRVGIGIYGLYPSAAARVWGLVDLSPALRWISILSHVKMLPKGCGVGYGHTWIAAKDTLVGTVPLGYADGYTKILDNKGIALVGGRRVPVIGAVCMDQFMLDLTEIPDARAGDEVVLIGRQGDGEIGADELGSLSGTINYEVVNRISARVPRRYTTD